MSDLIASIAPVSGSPFLGFDNIPNIPISVIDFHGTDDDVIPYDLTRYFYVLRGKSKYLKLI